MVGIGLIVAAPGIACAQEADPAASGLNAADIATVSLTLLAAAAALVWFWRADIIRPGSFGRKDPAEAPPIEAGPLLFAMMIGCFVLSALSSIVLAGVQDLEVGQQRTHSQQGVFAIAVGLAGMAAVCGAMLIANRIWKLPRFRLISRGWLMGLLLGCAVYPITLAVGQLSSLIFSLLGSTPEDAIGHSTLDWIVDPEVGVWRLAIIFGAVIATPVFEEILFRGLLQSAVVSIARRPWLAIVVTSALFTALHISAGIDPHTLPAIGTLGLAMGIAYERTGKISVPIAMHVLFNGVNVGLSFVLA